METAAEDEAAENENKTEQQCNKITLQDNTRIDENNNGDGTVSGELGNSVKDLGEGVGNAVEDVGDAVGNAAEGRQTSGIIYGIIVLNW